MQRVMIVEDDLQALALKVKNGGSGMVVFCHANRPIRNRVNIAKSPHIRTTIFESVEMFVDSYE